VPLICLDIETAPIEGVEQYLGEIRAPANYTKPESIAKYVEEKTAEERAKTALDPDLCRVVALAFQVQGEDTIRGDTAASEAGERELLKRWWAFVRKEVQPTYAGFNIAGFDLPVLVRRSQYLGVSYPSIRLGRYSYQMPQVVDLQNILTMDRHEKFRLRSKDWWVRRLGLAGADDTISGADVPAMIAMGAWDVVLKHCKADVAKEVQMLEWAGMWS